MTTSRRKSLIEAGLLIWVGTVLSILFVFDVYLPREVAITCILVLAVWGIVVVRANKFALLQRLVILIYSLPFSVTVGYLISSDYLWSSAPVRVVLIENDLIILQMLAIGLVGLVGLLSGMKTVEAMSEQIAEPRIIANQAVSSSAPQLSTIAFVCLGIASLLLVWLGSGSSATILESAYSGSRGIAESANFNAASLLAGVFLILLFVDSERTGQGKVNLRLKIVIGIALSAIVYELLRGNRDSFGLLMAFMALYVTGSVVSGLHLGFLQNWRRARRLVVPAIGISLIFVLMGAVRALLVNPELLSDTQNVLYLAFLENTWTAVLYSNLGLATLYSGGSMEYLLGQTYVDYVLSAPPGFVTQLFDITRPIEADRGPAWWFISITGGGVHAVVVPFRNFGIFGAMIILAAIGALVTWLDAPNESLGRRFLYGVMIAASFKWLWYGDMTLLRAMMAALLVWMVYRLLTVPRFQA